MGDPAFYWWLTVHQISAPPEPQVDEAIVLAAFSLRESIDDVPRDPCSFREAIAERTGDVDPEHYRYWRNELD
jgi:hypothetical protein